VARLEVVHQLGGDLHQLLHYPATDKPGDDAAVLAPPGCKDEESNLAVVVAHVHVSEPGSVGVGKPQHWSKNIGYDHVVPFHLSEHYWYDNYCNDA